MVMVEMRLVRRAPLQARAIWDYAQMAAPRREMVYLVLTHHHLDHCFAASYFDDRHALIYGHRSFSSCMAEMRKHLGQHDYQGMLMEMLKMTPETFRTTVGNVHPVAPHRHVAEELSLAINGDEIAMIHLPGHTRCELVVYHPRSKVLFAGDAINAKAGPVTMFGQPKDWQQWIAGLEKLQKLEIEKVVPGGLIIIDDYLDWAGCSRAVHDFLSSRKASEAIRQSRFGGVSYIVKRAPEAPGA